MHCPLLVEYRRFIASVNTVGIEHLKKEVLFSGEHTPLLDVRMTGNNHHRYLPLLHVRSGTMEPIRGELWIVVKTGSIAPGTKAWLYYYVVLRGGNRSMGAGDAGIIPPTKC